MKAYEVSFEKNGVYQSDLVHASDAKVAESWYISTHDGATVLSVREASADSYKPGKPSLLYRMILKIPLSIVCA